MQAALLLRLQPLDATQRAALILDEQRKVVASRLAVAAEGGEAATTARPPPLPPSPPPLPPVQRFNGLPGPLLADVARLWRVLSLPNASEVRRPGLPVQLRTAGFSGSPGSPDDAWAGG